MVKSDVRRDYYGDLGLGPNAESDEIKKQFRKLALKYHPDRNPGRELEFNAKFQAIQAAHEILSDPQQRLKYDTDRLRAGYAKFYTSSPKANTARKAPASPYTSTSSTKPQNSKPPPPYFARPTSFPNGGAPTGAQRFTNFARAAPNQSWQKKQDEGQTRADAFRGFQDMNMKGNSGTPGWSSFDPRTGRSSHAGGTARSNAPPPGQSGREPKSAYEYFKSYKTPTPDSAGSQSAKKKQGFAPRDAGGDEPMAANTSAYKSAPRTTDPTNQSVPLRTARKTAAAFGTRRAPDLERTSSRYATTGGERTFCSSAGLGCSPDGRESTDSPKSRSRTNPPSPTTPPSGRHRSASPHPRTQNFATTSPSSSETEDEEDERSPSRKPKAVPKSRLRPNQKFSDFHARQGFSAGTGHDSDSAASPRNIFGGKYYSPRSKRDPFDESTKAEESPQAGAFKSSSQGNLRSQFSAQDWHGAFQPGVFAPNPSDQDGSRASSNGRGRSTSRTGFARADSFGPDPARSGSASASQNAPPFAAEDWIKQFEGLSWAMPSTGGANNKPPTNAQQPRSPKKQTRQGGAKMRSAPQSASVTTEAEEATATVDGRETPNKQAGGVPEEAMDVDNDLPGRGTVPSGLEKSPGKRGASKSRPSSTEGDRGKEARAKSHLFNLKNFGDTAPFTNTNNGGINDLQDMSATLPFESQAKNPRTTSQDVRPRELDCPNPPRRPRRPDFVPVSLGSQQLALPRSAWDRYAAEMTTYQHEWNDFNLRMLRHFAARQEAASTGLSPNWVSAVGDSARLHINGEDDDADDDEGAAATNGVGNHDSSHGDDLVAGVPKGGFRAYLRGVEEDVKVRKHWEVACELHRDCLLELGQVREWILNGGKLI